jgi:hypothetical protein
MNRSGIHKLQSNQRCEQRAECPFDDDVVNVLERLRLGRPKSSSPLGLTGMLISPGIDSETYHTRMVKKLKRVEIA